MPSLSLGLDLGSAYPGMNIVPGNTPANGMSGPDFFLSGSEVPAASFLVSDYDPAQHDADGMHGTDTGYAPVLAPAVVDLLNQPGTIILDALIPEIANTGCQAKLLSDNPWLLIELDYGLNAEDDNAYIDASAIGVAPLADGRYRLALTRLAGGSWSASCNGNPVATGTGDNPLPTLEIVTLVAKGVAATIIEFTVGSPVADADLPALSALS